MKKILIVDDSPDIRQQLKWGLGEEYAVLLAGNADEGLELFGKHQPGVVLLDLGLPPHEENAVEGFRILSLLLDRNPHTKVVVLTGNNDRNNALKALRYGAYDFYSKPPVLGELRVIIARAFHLAQIEEQNRVLQQVMEMNTRAYCGIIGQCPEMQAVFGIIRKVASSDVPVLVTGESGTGKELVAQAIHQAGRRKEGQLVAINCGAIPENLLESELFGHEKGAFTGAYATVPGKLQYAHQGTLFLDEIGELPLNLQVKLLRFLQEGCIQRVGGRQNIPVDARTVCATNVDLPRAIGEGRFREDLFYRIGVITVHLPPLRERGDDIILLANHFLRLFNEEYGRNARRFSRAALTALKEHDWPGNVRELRNRVQRAIIMGDDAAISPSDLGFEGAGAAGREAEAPLTTLREARDRVERELISITIDRHHGNIVKVAKELGVSRPTLYDLMKKHLLVPLASGQPLPNMPDS